MSILPWFETLQVYCMFCTVIFLLQFSLLKSAMQILHGSEGRPLIIMLRWRLLKLWLTIFCLLAAVLLLSPHWPPNHGTIFPSSDKNSFVFWPLPCNYQWPLFVFVFLPFGTSIDAPGAQILVPNRRENGIKLAMLPVQPPNSSVYWPTCNWPVTILFLYLGHNNLFLLFKCLFCSCSSLSRQDGKGCRTIEPLSHWISPLAWVILRSIPIFTLCRLKICPQIVSSAWKLQIVSAAWKLKGQCCFSLMVSKILTSYLSSTTTSSIQPPCI